LVTITQVFFHALLLLFLGQFVLLRQFCDFVLGLFPVYTSDFLDFCDCALVYLG
jgi:hypothetical protein